MSDGTGTVVPDGIDLLDAAAFAGGQPHAQLRWLREHAPVAWHPEADGTGFWAVTRYDDVRAVSRDPETFSSHRGGVMVADADEASLAATRNMMLYMDPPEHTRYRRLVAPVFKRPAVRAWLDRIGDLAVEIVDGVCEAGACDLVADVAGEMPSALISQIMGIPRADGRRLHHLTETMHAAPGAVDATTRADAAAEMIGYALEVARAKRATPGDDLASLLLATEIDGDHLSDEEFCWFFLLLINAGGDTTRNLLGTGAHVLFEHPAELERFRADPRGLADSAVEELLRYVSPVVHMRRTATRTTQLGDQRIAAGDKVVVFYGSANRDERVFAEPDRLDLGRDPNPHVAFGGGGPHFCLGAHFARVEARATLVELLTRLPDIEPDGEPRWLDSTFIYGAASLPVRYTPTRPTVARAGAR